jgi:hypothetical protein
MLGGLRKGYWHGCGRSGLELFRVAGAVGRRWRGDCQTEFAERLEAFKHLAEPIIRSIEKEIGEPLRSHAQKEPVKL